jgi:hypothetical protein
MERAQLIRKLVTTLHLGVGERRQLGDAVGVDEFRTAPVGIPQRAPNWD